MAMIVAGLRPNPVFPAIGLFGLGLTSALVNTHLMLTWLMVPVGFLTAAPLAEQVFTPLVSGTGPVADLAAVLVGQGPGRGIELTAVAAGLCSLLLAAVGWSYRPIRRLEDELPDADSGTVIVADKARIQDEADRRLAELADAG
ncbi:hypothetical protein ACFWD1_14060 [Micromonospora chalcea]